MARKSNTQVQDEQDTPVDMYDTDLGPSTDEIYGSSSAARAIIEAKGEANGNGEKRKRRAFDLSDNIETLSVADIQPEKLEPANRAQWPKVLGQVAQDVLDGKVATDETTGKPQFVRVATYTQRTGAQASLRAFKKRIEAGENLYPEGYNGEFDFLVQPLKKESKLWVRFTPAS